MNLILGIESSCDETAAAVVEGGRTIRSNVVASQFDLHRPFGGVVPEVAARAHAERISAVIDEALSLSGCSAEELAAISVVNRPGLVGALLVGISAAKALAVAWEKPLIGVDHIQGHVYAAVLAGFEVFPHVSLIVSGGHTSLYKVDSRKSIVDSQTTGSASRESGGGGLLDISVLGQTADDAAGEAFDKVAKMLELGFPGGPALSKLADTAPAEARGLFKHIVHLALAENAGLDFSFSGLKTAVYYHLRGTTRGRGPLRQLSLEEKASVAASFQEAACEIMAGKALMAARREGIPAIAVGGGVGCNRRLRELFQERAAQAGVRVFFPPAALCTDNAAMSAGLAWRLFEGGQRDSLELDADPTPKRMNRTNDGLTQRR